MNKLETTLADLSKLRNVVEKDVENTVQDEFARTVTAIQTNDSSNLVKKTDYDTKIDEIKKKILSHHFTTPEFNMLTTENVAVKLKQAKLATKDGIEDFVKKADFDEKLININKKVISNQTKHMEAEKLNDHITSNKN